MSETAIVYVIDDDPSVRAALGSLLRSVGYRISLFASGDEFINADRPDCPGCLITDVRLPGISGLELQEHLARLRISIPIVLMTGFGDIPMSVRGMKAGAIDFLAKPFRDQDMLDAVCAAISSDRRRRTANAHIYALQGHYTHLSKRERQVMALVTAGRLNKQIADELHLSEVTVKIHRGSVMRKMEAKSLAELVKMAELLGINIGADSLGAPALL